MHFRQGQFKMFVGCDRKAHHLHSLLIGGAMPVLLMGWIAGRHEQDLLKTKLLPGTLPEDQMTHMDGIKSPSHDADFPSIRHNAFLDAGGRMIFFLSSLPSL